jgi:predicted metal-dependent hydrolase
MTRRAAEPHASAAAGRTREALRNEVRLWATRIGISPARVQIQHMTKKWASCSAGGRICLSDELLRESRAFRDVVIVHELLHLRIRNHGRLFRSLLKAHLPSWERVARGRVAGRCGVGG